MLGRRTRKENARSAYSTRVERLDTDPPPSYSNAKGRGNSRGVGGVTAWVTLPHSLAEALHFSVLRKPAHKAAAVSAPIAAPPG